MCSEVIIIVGGSFIGKSLIANHISNKYKFSGVLSTDMVRNFFLIQTKDDKIFSTSTYRMDKVDLDKQKELISNMVYDIIKIYRERKERIIIEGMHLTESLLASLKKEDILIIALDNKISSEDKIYFKQKTTRSHITLKNHEEISRFEEIHKEIIDICRNNEIKIVSFTDLDNAKKQCEEIVEDYLDKKKKNEKGKTNSKR